MGLDTQKPIIISNVSNSIIVINSTLINVLQSIWIHSTRLGAELELNEQRRILEVIEKLMPPKDAEIQSVDIEVLISNLDMEEQVIRDHVSLLEQNKLIEDDSDFGYEGVYMTSLGRMVLHLPVPSELMLILQTIQQLTPHFDIPVNTVDIMEAIPELSDQRIDDYIELLISQKHLKSEEDLVNTHVSLTPTARMQLRQKDAEQ